MIWPPSSKPSWLIYTLLVGIALAVCGWQVVEHRRVEHAATQALVNRGRDITSTLGVVVRSQRRFGLVSKERIGAALQDLVHPGDVESIAILGSTGEPIVGAGPAVELTPDMLRERGLYWRPDTLVIMNLMDLAVGSAEEGNPPHPPIVLSNEELSRGFRATRRPPPGPPPGDAPPESVVGTSGEKNTAPAPTLSPNPGPTVATSVGLGQVFSSQQPPISVPGRRAPFGRPPWMSEAEYQTVIQKQGVHSLVVSLSTEQWHHLVHNDLLLRTLVCALTFAALTFSVLAWRNVAKTADLQIRLIKAGEMNAHLKEMNLAAAGLAHETRNPLNLIRGFAQMIAMQDEGSTKLKEQARTIMEEADRVTAQLNEFINYSKPRPAQLAPVDLARIAADVARTLAPDTEEKKVSIAVPNTPFFVRADEQLFRQALFNLLLNAVQSVDTGGHVEITLTPSGGNKAILEVRDDGPGVPTDQREAIFKPYVTLRPKGVGLGLAIVHQIALAHHWEISCHQNMPRGAVFRMSHLEVASRSA